MGRAALLFVLALLSLLVSLYALWRTHRLSRAVSRQAQLTAALATFEGERQKQRATRDAAKGRR